MPLSARSPSALIEGFARDPGGSGKAMREVSDLDPVKFTEAVLRDESRDAGDRGFRYALILLRNRGLLIPAIADPAMTSFAQATRIVRAMLEIEKNFTTDLLDAALVLPDPARTACTLRILDVIADLCANPHPAGARLVTNWRVLTRLEERHGDGRVRSRCAALLSKYHLQEHSLLSRFEQSGPRERADLVEALWSSGLSKYPVLLEQALSDSDNRVAGNACLALYRAGEPRALSLLVEMIRSEQPEFQNTAAWAMGRLRDARFAPYLREAAEKRLPRLRRTALLSLANVERIDSCEVAADIIPVFVSAPMVKGSNELWIRVVRPDGTFIAGLGPTDFFSFTGQGSILDYSVTNCIGEKSTFIGVVWPAGHDSCRRAIVESSESGPPPSQVWALEEYGGDSGDAEANCWKLLQRETPCPDRHLVVLLDDCPATVDWESLRPGCQARGIRLHCRQIGKSGDTDVQRLWAEFIASFGSRYVIRTREDEAVRYLAIREALNASSRFSGVLTIDPAATGTGAP